MTRGEAEEAAHAGNQILWSLLPGESENRFPPRHVLSVSFSDLAKRLGVSRTHVRRMFEAAGRDGILTPHTDGGLNFNAGVQGFLGYLYSAQLMWLLAAAGIQPDKGVVEPTDVADFIALAKTRQWAREPKVRTLA